MVRFWVDGPFTEPYPAWCCALWQRAPSPHAPGKVPPVHAVGVCTHVCVAVSVHADALHLLRVHIQGCTAPQSGVTCPSRAGEKAEVGGELPCRERGQHRDSRALTGSGGDLISSSFSSWVEERWSCSSVFSACGRQRTGLGQEEGTVPWALCPWMGTLCTAGPQNPQTCTRGGRCPRGSTRPSSRTAAGSPPHSQDTPLHTPPRLPRGGSLSRCQRRKSRINLGILIPLSPTREAGAAPVQRQGLGDIPSATASPGDLGDVP